MLKKIQISGGFGSVEGMATHFKLVSSSTPVRVHATGRSGKVALKSEMRSPMAVEFGEVVERIEFHADTDQIIEIWYGLQSLEYMQLTAVGANRMAAKQTLVAGGVTTALFQANPRKEVRIRPAADIMISSEQTAANGWTIKAGQTEVIETAGEIYAIFLPPVFDYSLLSGAVAEMWSNVLTASLVNGTYWTYAAGVSVVRAQTGNTGRAVAQDGTLTSTNVPGSRFETYAGKIWQIRYTGAGTATVVSSVNGIDWATEFIIDTDVINAVAPGGIDANSVSMGINADWWTIKRLNDYAMAVNLATGETKLSPQRQSSSHNLYYWGKNGVWLSHKAGATAADGLFAHEGGVWVQKLIGNVAPTNWVEVFLAENGSVYLTRGTELRELNDDYTTAIAVASIGSTSLFNYVKNSGGTLFNRGDSLYYYRKGVDSGSLTVTGMNGGTVFYDATNERLAVLKGDTGTTTMKLFERAAPALPSYDPIKVELMELIF